MRRTTVVTTARGRHEHLRLQRLGLARSRRAVDHVVVAMGDPDLAASLEDVVPTTVVELTADGHLPLARARNVGAAQALRQGADLLVFLDVDCVPDPALPDAYHHAAGLHPHALLCGPVSYLPPPPPEGYDLDRLDHLATPHPARPAPLPGEVVLDERGHDLFWSLSFAVRPQTWATIGGFDEGYVGYGAEDTDLGRRAAAHGVPLAWVGGARSHHQFHPVSDPPVEHLEDILRNAERFAGLWGEWPMRGWLAAFARAGLVQRRPDGSYERT